MTLAMTLLEAIRPKQWIKNVLLFIGLVFAVKLGDPVSVARAVAAFAAFCALASAGYLFNDLADVEQDRQHPRKRRRPLASGRMSTAPALAMGSVLLLGSLALSLGLSVKFGLIALG